MRIRMLEQKENRKDMLTVNLLKRSMHSIQLLIRTEYAELSFPHRPCELRPGGAGVRLDGARWTP